MALAQGSYHQAALPRVRFDSWAEFARFVHQDGSTRGLFVRAAAPAAVDTDISVQFALPDGDEITLPGRVVQRLSAEEAQAMGEHAGMGVQFAFISDEQMLRIEQLLTAVAARQQRGSIPTAATPAPRQRSSAPPAEEPAPPAISGAPGNAMPVSVPAARAPGELRSKASVPAARGASAPAPAQAAATAAAAAKPAWIDTPSLQDPRLHQATSLLERGRFELAARHATEVLAEHPELTAAKILLLVIDARRLRAQFEFEQAIDCYHAVLCLDGQHREASEQLSVLQKELDHSQALFERVFGRRA